jgi:hypothetical protein
MKQSFLFSFIFLFISSLLAQGGNIFSTTSGKISFQSDAPFELIKASSKEVNGLLDPVKKTFAFKVRMESFQGFNSALQKEHFNENYIESDKYPDASFSGKIIEDTDFTKDGSYAVRAKGNFTVHGISQERIVRSDMVVKDGKINIHSAFTVMLSDHNIPIPKVVKDKLANEIKVDVNCLLEARKS